jgi:hypothetical protein
MIACDRLVEAHSTDRRHELQAQDRRRRHYKATPFAPAVIARANGRFLFLELVTSGKFADWISWMPGRGVTE